MENAMAPDSSTLAWKIPWMEEPGRLQSRGSLRVGHDWTTSVSLFTFMNGRRKWQPTPVFLPGQSPGMGEPGGLLSVGSHRVGHNWSDLAAAAAAAARHEHRLTGFIVLIIPWKIPYSFSSYVPLLHSVYTGKARKDRALIYFALYNTSRPYNGA